MSGYFQSPKDDPLMFPSDPGPHHEGIYVERWPNGVVKYQGIFAKGRKRMGQHAAYSDTGFVMELSYWIEGELKGVLLRFDENGERDDELNFGESGWRSGTYLRRTFVDDEVYGIEKYEDFCSTSEVEHTKSARVWREIDIDGILERARRDLEIENEKIRQKFGEE
jgi:hypothetical protein